MRVSDISVCFSRGLAISPSEICSATCGPDPGYLSAKSAEIIFMKGRTKSGNDFPLPADKAVSAVVPFAVGVSKQLFAVLGAHPHLPILPKSCWHSRGDSLCPKYVESLGYFLRPTSAPTNHFAPSALREKKGLCCWGSPTAVVQQSCL